MLVFFLSSKLVTSCFVLRQKIVKGRLVEARPSVFRDFHNSFGLPMCSVNFVIKNSIFFYHFQFRHTLTTLANINDVAF